jgi:hypothetical protein
MNKEKPNRAQGMQFVRSAALCLSSLVMSLGTLHAQTTSGSFTGRVVDQSGGVINNARVILRNEATGISSTQQTGTTGDYVFSSVQPGTYSITVTAPTFQAKEIDHLNLDIQQTLREDVALKAGEATTVVQVSAETPLIETDTTYVGSVVDGKQINQTPLNGRENAYSLMGLAPGVQRPNSNALISGSSFKGGASQTIDGISNDDIVNARMSDQVPTLDDVAQFNMIGIDAPAQYGNGSAQVIIVTKSGSNGFHGSLFYFNRNRFFQARNYFTAPGSRIPSFNRHEYGASIGGPVLRDRLFFFTSFEGIHSLTTVVRGYSMPPLAWYCQALTSVPSNCNAPAGFADFSSNETSTGTSSTGTIYDPATGQPFPNNQIPVNRISEVTERFLPYLSAPNVQTTTGLGNNFTYASPTLEVDPRWSIRADYQATRNDHLMFRYYLNRRQPSPYDVGGTDKFGNYAQLGNIINQFAGNYTRTISNSLINELVLGMNKRADPRVDQNHTIDPTTLVPGLPPTDPGWGLLPTVNIADLQKIFSTGSSFSHQHTTQVDDNLSYVKRNHAFQFGGQFMAEAESGTTYNTGTFSFDGQYTGRYHSGSGQSTNPVNAFADFLLGDINSDGASNTDFSYYALFKSYALYARDTWEVSDKLTLELGVRYDKLFPFQERRGGIATFNPDYGKLVLVHGTPSPAILAAYPGTVVDGTTINYNTSNWLHLQNTNFQPRIGFAYRPISGREVVVRAGFGIYYDNLPLSDLVNNMGNQLPFVLTTNFAPSSAISDTPSLTFDSPFPSSNGSVTSNPTAYGVSRAISTPFNAEWNLSIEGEGFRKIAVRATYVGNDGRHLHTPFPINQTTPQPLGGPGEPANGQAAVPFQPFSGITYYMYGESTNFNQLQLAARRRFSDLTFDAEYQWSKGLGIDGPNEETVTDRRNIRYDYGNLDYYAHNAFTFNYSYNLPVGQGKWLASNAPKWLDEAIGGWQLTGVWRAQSGSPFSVSYTAPSNSPGQPSGRADYITGAPLYPGHPTPKKWFNPGAFAPVPSFTYRYGNSQRNMVFGPKFSEWDAGMFKNFRLPHGAVFQFRAEAFNALNRANFGGPAANISQTSTVGQITSTSSDNRELQFGGRIDF